MENYPPGNTSLFQSCAQIESAMASQQAWGALKEFLNGYSLSEHARGSCYNMSAQLPEGDNATISSGDWSGVGTGRNGANWDYETCTFLVERIGCNGETDMFLPRNWTLDWLNKHCQNRFGVTPQPSTLSNLWGFGSIGQLETSHIVFTNGALDGWSAGGVNTNYSRKNIISVTFPQGAHHSDLSHDFNVDDTPAIASWHSYFATVLKDWLQNV